MYRERIWYLQRLIYSVLSVLDKGDGLLFSAMQKP